MARKQADYLSGLLDGDETPATPSARATPPPPDRPAHHGAAPAPAPKPRSLAGVALLGRESALARVASGEVRQVTQLLLDPARVRVWPGNARIYAHLTEAGCRELIDSIVAEGGQKVPAVVRRVEGDADHDYEVIAGTRRHWAISWLRDNSYPDLQFLAQVAALDDEAAFRLADLENRARKDVSDLERARNYAAALGDHYGGHLTRMAERLKVSKGWLSKMVKVAAIPDAVIAAFASPAEVALAPAYTLARALDGPGCDAVTAEAARIAGEQLAARSNGAPPLPFPDVLRRLLAAPDGLRDDRRAALFEWRSSLGRPGLTVLSANRQGVTLRLHPASGATPAALADALRDALRELDRQGLGLKR